MINQSLQKKGYAFIPSETLVLYGHFEGWLPIFKGTFQGKAGLPSERETQKEQKGELKVHIRYQTMEVMTVDKYDDLSNVDFFFFFFFLFFFFSFFHYF